MDQFRHWALQTFKKHKASTNIFSNIDLRNFKDTHLAPRGEVDVGLDVLRAVVAEDVLELEPDVGLLARARADAPRGRRPVARREDALLAVQVLPGPEPTVFGR
jgi:hypothetical protein